MIGDFHFLRSWWLLALVPCVLMIWVIRRREDAAQSWHGIVAPHLLPFLLQGQNRRARFTPLHLIAIGWLVTVLAIAGPTWRREPSPFADDTAALAIVVKASPSMNTEDVQPSRLTRATEKIHDLLKQRAGAKTSLIAYAGTAHIVMPATTDGGIIDTFAQALDPTIMPKEGDAAADALRLADQIERGELHGQRRDIVTYVCQRPGQFRIPAASLTWWDLEAKQLRTIDFPSRTFDVAANPAQASPSTLAAWWKPVGSMLLILLGLALASYARLRPFFAALLAVFRPVHLLPLNPLSNHQQRPAGDHR